MLIASSILKTELWSVTKLSGRLSIVGSQLLTFENENARPSGRALFLCANTFLLIIAAEIWAAVGGPYNRDVSRRFSEAGFWSPTFFCAGRGSRPSHADLRLRTGGSVPPVIDLGSTTDQRRLPGPEQGGELSEPPRRASGPPRAGRVRPRAETRFALVLPSAWDTMPVL